MLSLLVPLLAMSPCWVFLCGAQGIVHSEADERSHSGQALGSQIGARLGRIVQAGSSDRCYTAVYVKQGHARRGLEGTVRVARRYGYILHFPHGENFDPQKSWGREPSK